MATEVASAYVSIGASTKGLGKQISKEFEGVEGRAKKAGGKIGGAFKGAFKAGVVGIGAMGAAVAAIAIKGGIERALKIENAQAKLKGLGYDAKEITGVMDDALKAVKGTAFGLDEAATTAATAMAAGVTQGKDLEGYLRLVADAATIAGTDLGEMGSVFNKVQANGKLMTDNLNQLQDRGIPVLTWLADEYGVTSEAMSEMVSDGKVDAATFRKVMEKNLGGAALESGNTTQGAFKNMMASLSRAGLSVVNDIFPMFKDAFGGIGGALDTLPEKIAPIGKAFALWITDTAVPAVKRLGEFIKTEVVPRLQAFGDWFQNEGLPRIQAFTDFVKDNFLKYLNDVVTVVRDNIVPAVSGFVDEMKSGEGAGGKFADALKNITTWLTNAGKWIVENRTLVWSLVGAYAAFKVGSLIVNLTKATAKIVLNSAAWVKNTAAMVASKAQTVILMAMYAGEFVKKIALATGAWIANSASMVANKVAMVASKVATVVMSGATKAAAAAQWLMNAAMTANPIGLVVAAIALLVAGLVWFFTKTELGQKVWEALTNAFEVGWQAIKSAFSAGWSAIKNFLGKAWDFIKKVWSYSPLGMIVSNWSKITGTFSKAYTTIKGWLQKVLDFVKAIPGKIGGFLSGIGGKISAKFSSIKGTISGYITTVVNYFKGLPGRAVSGIGNIASRITGKFSSIKGTIKGYLDTVVNYFKGLPGRITSAVSGMFDGIKGAFKSAINWVVGKWNNLSFTIPGITAFGKTVGGFTLSTPNIPYLADGGVITAPTLAMVGEGRESEAVLPLSKLERLINVSSADSTPGVAMLSDSQIDSIVFGVIDASKRIARGEIDGIGRKVGAGVRQ